MGIGALALVKQLDEGKGMSIVLKPQHDIIPKMSGCQGAGTVASSSTTAMGVITVSSPAPLRMYVVCCVSHYTDLT